MTWHLSHRNLPLEGKIRSSRDESGGRREDMKAETVGNVMRVRERLGGGVKLELKKLHLLVWLHQGSKGLEREVLPLKMQRRKDVLTDWWSLKGLISSSRHIKASCSFSHIHTHCVFTFSTSSPFSVLWQQLRAQSYTLKKKNNNPENPYIFRLLICLHFLELGRANFFNKPNTLLSTLDDEEGQHRIAAAAAAVIAVGKGIKMFALSIPPSLCLYAVPSGCLSRPRARSSRWMGFPPITHSLKPSSLCKTTGGRKTERVGLCVSRLELCIFSQNKIQLCTLFQDRAKTLFFLCYHTSVCLWSLSSTVAQKWCLL